MLIQIGVENFKSFSTYNTFNMIASKRLKSSKSRLYETDVISLLKSSVIYGANAGGKTNLID